ncbi:MAG: restriction endonuclease subunit S [Phycisphaeraceae bacterium]|nr:restriction endonuclease subunit S [Phycisphaeraceae bacterium]
MSKDDKTTKPKPHLRFPQFRNAAGWNVKRLGTRGAFLSSLTGKSAADFDTGDARFIPYMNVFSNTFTDLHDLRAVDVGEGETQNAVARGDVFFTVSSETPEDAGMSSVLLGDIEDCYLNSFCALFRFHEGRSPDPVFLGYALRSGVVRKHLARSAQGATRYNISKGVFRDVPLLLPEPAEQRKIAECLGSLDDWIAAETEALAALRRHKTGLMQQLFPRPGESRPRLRFPEFRDTRQWQPKSIDELASFKSGGTPSKSNPAYWGGSIPWVSAKDMKKLRLQDSEDHITQLAVDEGARLVPAGTLLMLTRGMTLMKDVPICLLQRPMTFNQDIKALTPRKGTRGEFLAYLLIANKPNLRALVDIAGHGTGRLDTDEVKQLRLSAPGPAEQERIADCLVSLDALITAHADKLVALHDHKRGLMQQLFPTPDAADGGG